MRIFIDGLGLPLCGGARSSMLGWLAALGRYDKNNRYQVVLSRYEPVLGEFRQIQQYVIPVNDRFAVRIWAQVNLPRLLRREKPDLFHAMKNLMVFGIPCKSIVTINDLTHVVLADLFPWIDKVYWQVIQRAMLKSVDHVITISENTKQDVVQTYGLDEQKVSAIYPACGSSFHPVRDHDQEKQLQIKYGMSGPIILYVGGWAMHKNLQTIIAAYAQVSNRVSHDLVIVGGRHHTSSDTRLDAWINELNLVGRVHLLGTVPDSEMPHLYRMADLFVLPSLNEGFGLALLEAMASGTPALASRCSSLPEVGGDAVAWVRDPKNVREWSQALEALLNDVPRRKRLREAGLEKAKTFSWDETACQTLALYEQVVRY